MFLNILLYVANIFLLNKLYWRDNITEQHKKLACSRTYKPYRLFIFAVGCKNTISEFQSHMWDKRTKTKPTHYRGCCSEFSITLTAALYIPVHSHLLKKEKSYFSTFLKKKKKRGECSRWTAFLGRALKFRLYDLPDHLSERSQRTERNMLESRRR